MKEEAKAFWERANLTLDSARSLLENDPDSAASRAYYAAFYAVSGLFALRDQSFSKHSALESAVHRDLVRPGLWPPELGEAFSSLIEVRNTGDYGVLHHATRENAQAAVAAAARILEAVHAAHPEIFPRTEMK